MTTDERPVLRTFHVTVTDPPNRKRATVTIDPDPLDNVHVRHAVAVIFGCAAAKLDPDTSDDDVLTMQSAWPANIGLQALLIGTEAVIAMAVFTGTPFGQLYEFGQLAMPTES